MPNERKGKEAEDKAADYLLEKGYTLITRRYRVKGGEIDIIALDGDTLVFAEVKERLAPGFSPEQAVHEQKVIHMLKAGEKYRQASNDPRPFRFDLIAMDQKGIRHYEACFGASLNAKAQKD
ncbi:MAG TPA: YraN family protein [Fimbriimonadaceae bacterium]|jgi:putative endonuclease